MPTDKIGGGGEFPRHIHHDDEVGLKIFRLVISAEFTHSLLT